MKMFFSANKIFFKIAWEKQKSYYFIYLLRIIFSVLNTMLIVYMPKLVLDAILEKKDFLLSVYYTCIIISISLLWSYIERKITIKQQLNLTNILLQMKGIVYDKIINNNTLSFENNEYFDSLSRALHYTESAGDGAISLFSNVIICILNIIGVSYVIGQINILVVIALVIAIILSHICMKKVNKLWFEYQNKERLPRVRFINHITNLFKSKEFITEIKLNNANDFAKNIVLGKSLENAKHDAKKDAERFKWNYLSIILNNIHQFVSNIYFGFLLFKGIITIATYSSLFVAIQQLFTNFNSLLALSIDLGNKMKEANYYMDFINDNQYLNNGNIIVEKFEVLDIENLKFKYPKQESYAINGITMQINKGEKVAIVGENGSGKTTFIKLLMGLYPCESGNIWINNIDIKEIDVSKWMKIISPVMQHTLHLPIEIRKDIAFSFDSNDDLILESLKFASMNDTIDKLPNKLNTVISKEFDENGIDFSGGEKQKLSIARAFYKQAELLIFDEPSSALDPNAEYELFNKINQLGKDKTTIFVSHRLSTTVNADKILVFKNGEIVESGNHKELIGINGIYADMFKKQASNYIEGSNMAT